MGLTVGDRGSSARLAIVAIPANNEAERIPACLTALAAQRNQGGAPLAAGLFEVLVFANNCVDETAAVVRALAGVTPHPVTVTAETLPPDKANAGWARKRAMDLAAGRLVEAGCRNGLILTTDADSTAASTWVDATFRAFDDGADCVAGYIDAHPGEMMELGPAFVRRGCMEDHYLSLLAEIQARCDPQPHDPWPNHRVSSGASLAVSLAAYTAVGGLPPMPVGEDAALTHVLKCAGFKVRHAMDVCVSTSCRLDGRAPGGAAETMQHRRDVPDAPCDADIEPALAAVRRALWKGVLRRQHAGDEPGVSDWARRLGLHADQARGLSSVSNHAAFEDFWLRVAALSPMLNRRPVLRPSDLPRQIERAEMCLRVLRRVRDETAVRGDTSRRSGSRATVAA